MRKSGGLAIPLTLIIMYYGFWIGLMWYLLSTYPGLNQYFPIGGVEFLAEMVLGGFNTVMNNWLNIPDYPVKDRLAQTAALCIGHLPDGWLYGLGEAGDHTGVDAVGLGQAARGPGEVTDLARVHHRDGKARLRQRRRGERLEFARHFQSDTAHRQRL